VSGRAPRLGAASSSRDAVDARLSSLEERFCLSGEAVDKLQLLLERLADDPHAPTSVRDPLGIVDNHLADSLVALELEPVRESTVALDLGSGAGLPGIPLAIALPRTSFTLLESAARKCLFLESVVSECGLSNVKVVHERAESYRQGRDRHDLVTARAVAGLEVTAEYAAPLLRVGGTLLAWAGKRSTAGEAAAIRAAQELGLEGLDVRRVEPFPESHSRHLYLTSKVRPTPSRFPRRPGVAAKHPLG